MIGGLLAKLGGAGIGAIATGVGDLAIKIRQAFTGEMSPEDKADVEKMLVQMEMQSQILAGKVKEMQSNVIVAEAKAGGLAANWRPVTMLVFVFIVFNNYILYPYLSLFWEVAPVLAIPDHLWELLKIGLGGYIVGRSAEQTALKWKSGSNTLSQIQTILADDDLEDKQKLTAIKQYISRTS